MQSEFELSTFRPMIETVSSDPRAGKCLNDVFVLNGE